MVEYSYRPLEDPLNDIRVAHILPGSFDDEIRLNISHKSLTGIQPAAPRPAVDIKSLRASLPPGWSASAVCEEWDHRVLFQDLRRITVDDRITNRKTSWDHPNPNFDRSVYHPLDVTPPDVGFEALSYVWGSLEDPVTVRIIEGPSSSTLPITQNLACAIRHLRRMDVPRLLWIDAICIAQEDKEERAVQVQRMADIYRLANGGVIWLGEHFDDSERAIRLVQQLGESMVMLGDESWDWTPSYTAYQPQPESLWPAFTLFQRPWFSRLWVVQEIQ